MATYGYARVSSSDQSTDTQVQRLKAAGCQIVRTEKISGKSREGRDQLATLLEFIGPGDVLACVKLDRLAEMELGFIKARQRDGIERAKSKGDVYKGRKTTIDRSTVRDLFSEGIGASEIARRLKIGRASVYRVLEQ